MSYRITAMPPADVIASWPPDKQRRYAQSLATTQELAARYHVSLQTMADAVLLRADLSPLFLYHEADEFLPIFCTQHASPPKV